MALHRDGSPVLRRAQQIFPPCCIGHSRYFRRAAYFLKWWRGMKQSSLIPPWLSIQGEWLHDFCSFESDDDTFVLPRQNDRYQGHQVMAVSWGYQREPRVDPIPTRFWAPKLGQSGFLMLHQINNFCQHWMTILMKVFLTECMSEKCQTIGCFGLRHKHVSIQIIKFMVWNAVILGHDDKLKANCTWNIT